MIGVHVVDGALLGFQQRTRIGNIGQKPFGLEIHDAPEAGHQMGSARPDPEEGKILKIYKGFRRRMGVEVAPAHDFQIGGRGLIGPARQHDPRSLQRVALGPLVQHQRDPGIGEDVFGVHRQPRNQQDRRAIGMAGDIDQRAIGIAAAGHQGRQGPLPAAAQQRPGQPAGVEISGGLHRSNPHISLQ